MGEDINMNFQLPNRAVGITTATIRKHRHEVLMTQLAEKELASKGRKFYQDCVTLDAPYNDLAWAISLGDTATLVVWSQRSNLCASRSREADTIIAPKKAKVPSLIRF